MDASAKDAKWTSKYRRQVEASLANHLGELNPIPLAEITAPVLGFINTKQNDIFQVLTVISIVGIPPTLVASIYGMNFKNMPELSWAWGYPYGLVLILLSAILPILWFKWRRWV